MLIIEFITFAVYYFCDGGYTHDSKVNWMSVSLDKVLS